MKIFSWVQNKINGRQESKRWTVGSSSSSSSSNRFPIQEPCKEEFSDWPHGLLAIGTFGNNQVKEEIERHDRSDDSAHSPLRDSSDLTEEASDFTKEEVGKLQQELIKLLSLTPKANAVKSGDEEEEEEEEEEKGNLPLDKFLNCPSSLEVDRINCPKFYEDYLNGVDGGDLSRNNSVVSMSKGKDVCMDKKNVIRQRSLTFLLKKMFACRGGFAPTPSLRDSMPESRMEKLMRTILHKKIYPRNSASSSSRKYLPSTHTPRAHTEDPAQEKANDGSKWDKTDSECKSTS